MNAKKSALNYHPCVFDDILFSTLTPANLCPPLVASEDSLSVDLLDYCQTCTGIIRRLLKFLFGSVLLSVLMFCLWIFTNYASATKGFCHLLCKYPHLKTEIIVLRGKYHLLAWKIFLPTGVMRHMDYLQSWVSVDMNENSSEMGFKLHGFFLPPPL